MTSVSTSTDWASEDALSEDAESFASTARVSVRLIEPFVQAAEDLGVRADAMLASVGLSKSDFDNSEMRVSHAIVSRILNRVLDDVASASQNKACSLGLLAAEHLQPQHLDVVEYAVRFLSTWSEAIDHAKRYYALLHEGLMFELQPVEDHYLFSWSFGPAPRIDVALEFVMAAHLAVARRITGLPELAPSEAHFQAPRPNDTSVHERFFKCPLRFDQPRHALVLSKEQLSTPLAIADAGLAKVLDRHAAESLHRLGLSTSLPERVREIVRQDLTSGKLSADSLARRLGMSSRTLHRRLVAQNSSYRQILDDVRREIALRCLRDPQLSIREVGFLLGFTTGPAFHRAFRRWTGTTAASFRSQCNHPPNA
jgi:AraC-like DNA-binding protein